MDSSSGILKSKPDTQLDKCYVCQKWSSLKCSNCVKTYYCSAAHQKQDWKRHKLECHPFEVGQSEKFGRYLVASRDIKSGEIILKESPLICGPSQITCPVCVRCLQGLDESDIDKSQECRACGWPVCQRCKSNENENENDPHSMKHDECAITRARGNKFSLQNYFNPHPTYQCLMVLRCLLLKENFPAKWERLIQLESHCEQRRRVNNVQWCNDREGVAKFIPRFFKCPGRWSENEILKVAGIVQINGHEIPLTDPPHVAIYNLASLVEHSCVPNLTKSFTSAADLIFWAPYAIKKGEHLSICYSDALWGTENRQNHLFQTKMFHCDCPRCSDVTEFGTYYSALKCPNCDGMLVPEHPTKWQDAWKCNACEEKFQQTYVRKILDRAANDSEAMDKSAVDQGFKYIDHYSKWLPSNHHYLCDVQLTLTQAIGGGDPSNLQLLIDEQLELKISFCQKLLRLFGILAAAESRCLGALHFELHAALAELGRRSMQNGDNKRCRMAIEDSLKHAEETVRYLQHEPLELNEGQICQQSKANAESLKAILASNPKV